MEELGTKPDKWDIGDKKCTQSKNCSDKSFPLHQLMLKRDRSNHLQRCRESGFTSMDHYVSVSKETNENDKSNP